MKKWLVGGFVIAAAAIGVGAFALRNPGALAGSIAHGVGPARANFCSTDYCGHGGPGAKAEWCGTDYRGHSEGSASH